MSPITPLAVTLANAAGTLSRRLRLGGGTTLPGTLARRLAPNILRELSAALPHGVLLLSGTNGKTTTSRMLAEILGAHGERVLHNRAGANLIEGLTATSVADADWRGRPRASLGLFETDEAALPQAVAETAPRLVLIHNLFRDQLDRYGEVDTVAGAWRAALATLPGSATVVLNADDPAVADLGRDLAAQVVYYGLEDTRHASDSGAHIADSQFCRRCGARYAYRPAFYAHIGHYACPQCGHARPAPQVRLARLDLDGTRGSRLFLAYPGGALELDLPLPGIYNALNATAAAAAALSLGVAPAAIRATLEQFSAAFGRIERLSAGPSGAPMLIALIKNPVGATETVRMLVQAGTGGQGDRRTGGQGDSDPQRNLPLSPSDQRERVPMSASAASGPLPPHPLREQRERSPLPPLLHLLIAINDKFADGTDVSWLWDADFEALAGHVAGVTVSGTRADDMAVRLKYADIPAAQIRPVPELPAALDAALAALPPGATLTILPTYTAMLELRDELARRGWVKPFWEH